MIARYTRPQMGRLFTDKYKFDTWLKVELAVCEAWAEQGAIPRAAFERIKKNARFSLTRIRELEERLHHDVISFTTAVAESIGDDSAYFHKGLTSNDVVDTAQNLILKRAGQLLEQGLGHLRRVVGEQALRYKYTPMIGRTHGVHAEPTTFGLRLLIYHDELDRHEERLAAAVDGISVGKLSGAVGNFANIPPAIEERVLKELGLRPAPVSNQVVQRDRHAHFVGVLAGIGATLEKIAVHLRTGQRTELGEVQEPFAEGQKGSSAMPHKRNPELLERVTGLARVLRGYALTALENVALWDERDISNSGAERVILPDACILLDYMLATAADVMAGLVVREERMRQNIHLTRGLVFSQRVLLRLTEAGLSREEAYGLVQRNALRCWEEGTPLLDALDHDPDVRRVLSTEQLSELFSLDPYLRHVDAIFERVGLSKRLRRRRGRGRIRDEAEVVATGGSAPIQNIEERVSDWYESAALITDAASKGQARAAADETLGEALHQKKTPRTRARRTRAKPAAKKAGAVKEAPEPKAKPAAEPAAADEKPQAEQKPARRRRGTRGGRRRKKAAEEPKAAPRTDDDDTYID